MNFLTVGKVIVIIVHAGQNMSNYLNIKFKEEKYINSHYSNKINKPWYFITWWNILLHEK